MKTGIRENLSWEMEHVPKISNLIKRSFDPAECLSETMSQLKVVTSIQITSMGEPEISLFSCFVL